MPVVLDQGSLLDKGHAFSVVLCMSGLLSTKKSRNSLGQELQTLILRDFYVARKQRHGGNYYILNILV